MIPLPRRVVTLLAAAAAVLPLAACATTVSGRGTRAVSDFPSSTVSATPTAEAEQQQAEDLVFRTRTALAPIDVAVDATLHDEDGELHVTGRWGATGNSATLSFGYIRMQVIGVGGQVYVQAPQTYWATLDLAGAAAVRSDQWVWVEDPNSDGSFPAAFGKGATALEMALPDPAKHLELTSDSVTGGRHTAVVTDEDGWAYT